MSDNNEATDSKKLNVDASDDNKALDADKTSDADKPADDTPDAPEETPPEPEEKPSVLRTIRNVILGLLVLIIAVVGGFAWAVKTGKLSTEDVAMINKELGLYRLPYVGNGKYFEVPEGVEWPPKEESKPEAESETPEDTPVEPEKPKPAEKPTEVKIDRKAIEEQRLKREAEEKKRVTRLARIYENMKPEAAANALINVDWDTTVLIFQRMSEDSVAQILSKMEPEAAAQLTEMLFAGTQRRVTTPYDTMRGEPVNEPYTE